VDIPFVEHPESVTIVAVEGDQLVCVRQTRAGANGTTLELPSGKIEPSEHADAAARRELAEECALQAREWRKVGEFWAAPAYSTELVHVFVAGGLSPADGGAAALDEDEEVETERIPLAGVLEQLSDASSIAALALWLEER